MAGMDQELDQPDMAYITIPELLKKPISNYLLRMSLFTANLHTVERLRVRLWNQLDRGAIIQFVKQALLNLDTMRLLQAKLTQPSLGIDDGADFLLEIMHSPFNSNLPSPYWRLYRYISIANLLACQDQASINLAPWKRDFHPNKDCIIHIFELCNNIKKSPRRLARLLARIATFELREHYLGANIKPFDPQLYELAGILRRHRDALLWDWDMLLRKNQIRMGQLGSKEEFGMKCTQVIYGITGPKLVTFGLRTSRTIACARPYMMHDAAPGWLGIMMKIKEDAKHMFQQQ
ncbi:hypothetical protein CPB86DRAFT_830575 [Serendipita vermifera]|nr:hypothetical protein CPB86DRAFT_830575 [Serendipita vermifera]